MHYIKKIYILMMPLFIFFIVNAQAARIITFYASGDNTALYGRYHSSPNQAFCQITINNQSGVDQTYTITIDSSTAATGTGAGAITQSSNPNGLTLTGTPLTYSTTISTDTSHNYTFTYPSFPASTIGTQHVECNGSLSIDDVTNAGSLGFAGFIRTYNEYRRLTDVEHDQGGNAMPGFVPLGTKQN